MARIAAAALALTACGALKTEPMKTELEPMPGDWRQLGQTGKAMTFSDGIAQFGAEAAAAEAAAVRAREDAAAAVAAEGADAQMSAREMDAYSRHAESQVHSQEQESMLMDKEMSTMWHVADFETRSVADMERQVRQLDGTVDDLQRATTEKVVDPELNKTWWVESPEQMQKRLERIGHKMDQMERREEGNAALLFSNARKQLDSTLAKERAYLHHRGALEHEAQMRLAERADALRAQAASNGSLSLDETLRLLDTTKQDLDNITSTLDLFAKLPAENMTAVWIEEKLDTSRSKIAIASAKMVEAIKHKVETFKNHHNDYNDLQFLSVLSRTLNETMDDIKTFDSTKDFLMTRLRDWDQANGEKLTINLANAIRGVTDSVEFRSHLMRIDTARLANTQVSEACGNLTSMVTTSMAPAYQMLVHQKEKLDEMSKIVPTVTWRHPDFIQERMGARANALLNMAYIENLALKEAAMHIIQEASPVVMSRLHCTMRSASARSGLGVVTVLAAAMTWLAQ